MILSCGKSMSESRCFRTIVARWRPLIEGCISTNAVTTAVGFLWLAIVIPGCGGGRAEVCGAKPYPVTGKVAYQGKPAAGFQVVFNPVTEQNGPRFAPSGTTNDNGEFHLRSYQADDGAPPGEYAVTFTWLQPVPGPDPGDAPRQIDRLRGRYSDPTRSVFKVSVHEGDNTLEPFTLK